MNFTANLQTSIELVQNFPTSGVADLPMNLICISLKVSGKRSICNYNHYKLTNGLLLDVVAEVPTSVTSLASYSLSAILLILKCSPQPSEYQLYELQ